VARWEAAMTSQLGVAAGQICAADPTLPACVRMESDALWIMWSAIFIFVVCAIITYTKWRIGRPN
jgi:hypothetical protein